MLSDVLNVKLKKVAFSQILKRKNFLKSQAKLRRRNFLLQKKGKIKVESEKRQIEVNEKATAELDKKAEQEEKKQLESKAKKKEELEEMKVKLE